MIDAQGCAGHIADGPNGFERPWTKYYESELSKMASEY